MTDIDAIRARHVPDHRPNPYCVSGDMQEWPCDTAVVLAALEEAEAREARLRAALKQTYLVLAQMNQQWLDPGPDRLVAVTVEAWGDGIRPVIELARTVLRPEDGVTAPHGSGGSMSVGQTGKAP